MNWLNRLRNRFRTSNAANDHARARQEPREVVITAECLTAITEGLTEKRAERHEGVLYLLGVANESVTLIAGAIRPGALTTAGSFDVPATAMATVVRTASNTGLHVVGQLHTHPGAAYHSQGDEQGAWIRFPGFTSIVIPSYGDALPEIIGSAVFVVDQTGEFQETSSSNLRILPEGALWHT